MVCYTSIVPANPIVTGVPWLKRAAILSLCMAMLTWLGCGGSSKKLGSTGEEITNTNLSKIKTRVFVSNTYAGVLNLVDGSKDALTTFTISTDAGPKRMQVSSDKIYTLVYGSTNFSANLIWNENEKAKYSAVALGGASDSLMLSADSNYTYAAVPSLSNSGRIVSFKLCNPSGSCSTVSCNTLSCPAGAVQQIYWPNQKVQSTIPIQSARYVSVSPDGKTVLAFSDAPVGGTIVTPGDINTMVKIDTTTNPVTLTYLSGFDHPVDAIWSSDGTKAYILNCGAECGGTQASVMEYTLSSGTVTRTAPVSNARAAVLQGTTLYVTGGVASAPGTVQVVDTTTMTASTAVPIGYGTHTVIKYAASKVWIGAQGCGGLGCLTLFDPTSKSVVVDTVSGGASKGDVTGMAYIDTRNLMYVAEGGELLIYNTSGVQQQAIDNNNLDIVGQAWDVVYVPQ